MYACTSHSGRILFLARRLRVFAASRKKRVGVCSAGIPDSRAGMAQSLSLSRLKQRFLASFSLESFPSWYLLM